LKGKNQYTKVLQRIKRTEKTTNKQPNRIKKED